LKVGRREEEEHEGCKEENCTESLKTDNILLYLNLQVAQAW
jgi:hypothetical protein